MLRLTDSLSGDRKFLPENQLITLYLCGPTLYNYLHLGNLRPIVIFDFLIRYLREKNIRYEYIQNLTDIDEKILLKAQKEKRDITELTSDFALSFFDIFKKLNLIAPQNFPSVSENIGEIQIVIESLISQDLAFWDRKTNTVKFRQQPRNPQLNYFSTPEEEKRADEANFALWKENTLTPFSIDSPWFRGIPGWHVECFSLIQKYFSLPITIHGGGVDLKFPHHENVNLMSRASFNKEIAEIWVHIGQVLNEEGKLSKSSNYSWKVEECAEKYSWNLLRYLFMKVGYSKPLTLSTKLLDSYQTELNSYTSALNYSEILLDIDFLPRDVREFTVEKKLDSRLLKSLENDLNLPEVLSLLEELKQKLLNAIKQKDLKEIKNSRTIFSYHLEWLGFRLPTLSVEDKKIAKEWMKLVEEKKYSEADLLRKKLSEKLLIV